MSFNTLLIGLGATGGFVVGLSTAYLIAGFMGVRIAGKEVKEETYVFTLVRNRHNFTPAQYRVTVTRGDEVKEYVGDEVEFFTYPDYKGPSPREAAGLRLHLRGHKKRLMVADTIKTLKERAGKGE